MEKTLSYQSWLASDTFSLADIAMTPYVNRLDMLGWPRMWERTRPHVVDGFERIRVRPAFKPALLD
jgi:ganglioside-induced differentiation-associated protein 1